MPRGRKKKELPEPVLTNGLKDTNIVQKSKPLFSLWKSKLTLSEFKILDTYLSRINSNNPESRSVVFEKGELEKLLEVTKINRPELQKRLKHLQGTIVSVGEGKDIDEITLFERSQAVQDEDGLWQIRLTASLSAMKYIFNIEKIGYFRYKMRAVTKLRSLYSYTLFMYLEYNKYRGKWMERLDELKKILGCETERYTQFKFLNSEILKKCQAEIMENTPIRFDYIPIKKGRKVVAIEFDIKKSQEIEIVNENPEPQTPSLVPSPECEPEQVLVSSYDEKLDEESIKYYESFDNYHDDNISFLAEACNYDFTESQMKEIYNIISYKNLPYHPYGKEFSQYDYLFDQYIKFNNYTKDKGMDNKRKFSYFRRMLENDK